MRRSLRQRCDPSLVWVTRSTPILYPTGKRDYFYTAGSLPHPPLKWANISRIIQSAAAAQVEQEKPLSKDMEKTSSTTSLIPEAHQRKPKNSTSFHLHGNAFLRRV
ncbi:hypothetical protein AVEN_253246-1 [Araneus ventricosus]|uniref:Uncharacterized protein n=1 Tax=Araneus ventricosus TaxID=182803 RepID=A0A4Y2MX84_ARAVE|nr:hypothetical protein AVEN_253246-1 [Araneus ventricosus]